MKRTVLIPTLLLLLAATGTAAQADIYRSKNDQGNPVFSDQPSPESEAVDLPETNTTPAVEPRERPQPKSSDKARSYQVQITEPADGAFIHNGLRPTAVLVSVSPPLLPKHSVELLLDGNSVGKGASTHFSIPRLMPGSHQLSARVLDNQGKLLGQSGTVKVLAQWPGGKN